MLRLSDVMPQHCFTSVDLHDALLRGLLLFEFYLPMIDIPIQCLTLWPVSSTMGVLKIYADLPVACDTITKEQAIWGHLCTD